MLPKLLQRYPYIDVFPIVISLYTCTWEWVQYKICFSSKTKGLFETPYWSKFSPRAGLKFEQYEVPNNSLKSGLPT